jgi:hypothetical protein
LITGSASAAVLLGGFDGASGTDPGSFNNPKQDASAVGNVSVTLAASSGGPTGTPFQTASGGTWGTQDFDPDPSQASSGGPAVARDNSFTLTTVITNTGSADVTLSGLHWRNKADATGAATSATFTYASGDLADADGTNTAIALPGGINNLDYDLSNLLTDLTLAAGESATFTWEVTGTRWTRVDNWAFSGDVVPEPTSLALLGLGGLLVARRRK